MKSRQLKLRNQHQPIYAHYLNNKEMGLIVKFTGLKKGVVIKCDNGCWKIGQFVDYWIEYKEKFSWEILKDYKEND